MRLTKLVRRQLVAFTLLGAAALVFTAITYGNIGATLGVTGYTVRAEFADASGLYPRANVTYRGVTIGTVESISPTTRGAVVTMYLHNGTSIPSNVIASLRSTSAIGEQFVDLVPSAEGGQTLHDGAVIVEAHTRTMPQIGPVLDKLNALLNGIPQQPLTNVLTQLDEGFNGTGSDVGTVISQTSTLVNSASARILQTRDLIEALAPVLHAQAKLAPQTEAYLGYLQSFTQQLASTTPVLDALLQTGPQGLAQTTALVTALRPIVPTLLGNTHNALAPAAAYRTNLTELFATYPALMSQAQRALETHSAQGEVSLNLTGNIGDPAECIAGYMAPTQRRSPSNTSVRAVNGTAHCQVAAPGPSGVRGLRNDPCPNSSARAVTPAGCGLLFSGSVDNSTSSAASSALVDWPYTASTTTNGGPLSWLSLLIGPLGLL